MHIDGECFDGDDDDDDDGEGVGGDAMALYLLQSKSDHYWSGPGKWGDAFGVHFIQTAPSVHCSHDVTQQQHLYTCACSAGFHARFHLKINGVQQKGILLQLKMSGMQ